MFKKFLKKFLPPPVNTFNREVGFLQEKLGTLLAEQSVQQQAQEDNRVWQQQQIQTLLDGQAALLDRLDQMELGHKKDVGEFCRLLETQRAQMESAQIELGQQMELAQARFNGQLQTIQRVQSESTQALLQMIRTQDERHEAQLRQSDTDDREERGAAVRQLTDAIWDSRNKALWETKDEINRLGDQVQQMYWYHRAVTEEKSLTETKVDFFRALPKAEGKLRVVQQMELYLLKSFKRICEENGLRYWMQGGSLLGAIRHQGFIPWDDDLDVSMPREDLRKLRSILKDSAEFAIQDYYQIEDRYWQSRISKFMCPLSGTTLFIDIFAYDCIPCREEDQPALWEHICACREELCDAMAALIPSLDKAYRDVPITNKVDRDKVDALFDAYVAKVTAWSGSKSSYAANAYCWSVEYSRFDWCRIFREETILPTVPQKFETETVQIPRDSQRYLQAEYPNYLSFPKDVGYTQHWQLFSMEKQVEAAEHYLKAHTE